MIDFRDIWIQNNEYEYSLDNENIIIQPLDKDKKQEQEKTKKNLHHTPATMIGTYMILVTNLLNDLIEDYQFAKTLSVPKEQNPFCKYFTDIEKLFKQLQMTDISEDEHYAQKLSNAWHELLQNFIPSVIDRLPKRSTREKIRFFLKDIQKYPPTQEHSLGHYLTQYAGEDWLPFPFITILNDLHQNHAKNPKESTLTLWIALINEIVKELSLSN